MNYAAMLAHLRAGGQAKRPHWETALENDRKGRPVFRLTPDLLKQCNEDKSPNPYYHPTEIELFATDWEMVSA